MYETFVERRARALDWRTVITIVSPGLACVSAGGRTKGTRPTCESTRARDSSVTTSEGCDAQCLRVPRPRRETRSMSPDTTQICLVLISFVYTRGSRRTRRPKSASTPSSFSCACYRALESDCVVVTLTDIASASFFYRWPQIREDHPPNLSILVSGGKETNQDFLSSGERTGMKPSTESRRSLLK